MGWFNRDQDQYVAEKEYKQGIMKEKVEHYANPDNQGKSYNDAKGERQGENNG